MGRYLLPSDGCLLIASHLRTLRLLKPWFAQRIMFLILRDILWLGKDIDVTHDYLIKGHFSCTILNITLRGLLRLFASCLLSSGA